MAEKTNTNEEIIEEKDTKTAETADCDTKKNAKADKKASKLLEKQLEDALKAADEAKKEKEALNDTYLRMLAEYDNFRKRAAKEKETIYSDGTADAVEKLLPVLDNLDRAAATEVSSPEAQAVLDGVNKVIAQALEIFAKLGVSEIPAKGEKFDPELHNAVMHDEDPEAEENTVSEVFLKGYKLGDKVIRHSMVKVVN